MEHPIKLTAFAAKMHDHIALHPCGDMAFDALNTGYQVFTSRMQDKDGRELGWIVTAAIDETTEEGSRISACGYPEGYIISGTGIKPRLFPTLNSVLKALVGIGCANFVVLAD